MQRVPHNEASERAIINCLLSGPPTRPIEVYWFWSEGRAVLCSACEFFWQRKLFHHARPRKSIKLEILEADRAADRNAATLLRHHVHTIGPWPSVEALRLELMAIREADGIVMFTGCSHSGALNMVRTVVERFPKVPIKAVVGGFHLIGPPLINPMGDTEAAVLAIGRELLTFPVERYYTGHCTGAQAYQLLRGVMGERLQGLSTGTVIIV